MGIDRTSNPYIHSTTVLFDIHTCIYVNVLCYETLFLFLTGDIVGLFSSGKPIAGQQISGVVVHSSNVQVSLAFDDLSDSVDLPAYNGMIQLVKLANDVTYRRIKRYMYCICVYSCYCICNC